MSSFFFFNDTATTEIYTLSLHDALPILPLVGTLIRSARMAAFTDLLAILVDHALPLRSEEHTSELQSHLNLVCRLLLEKKKPQQQTHRQARAKRTRPSAASGPAVDPGSP